MFRIMCMIEGRISFRSFVGIGSKRQDDVFEDNIIDVSWVSSTAENLSKDPNGSMGLMACGGSKLLFGNFSFILSLIEEILLLKNWRKSSLLSWAGMEGSNALWLFVSLATVLNKNLGLFLLASINEE